MNLEEARLLIKIFNQGKFELTTEEEYKIIDEALEISLEAGDCWLGDILYENFNERTGGEKMEIEEVRSVKVRDLILRKKFLGSRPSAKTYAKHLKYFKANGEMDKPIEVHINRDGRFVVHRGYARYSVLINNGIEQTQVKIISIVI